MAELLSHVLIAYVCFTIASWRLEWLTKRWIAVGIIGSLLPDLNRLSIVVSETAIEATLGVPFDLDGLHTLGGVLILAGIGALCFADEHRRAFGVLLAGAVSHLLVDAAKMYADGDAATWLYPFTWYRHPSPNLYVSSDPAVLVVSLSAAAVVWLLDRRYSETS